VTRQQEVVRWYNNWLRAMRARNGMTKVRNRLPARPRLRFGSYTLIPFTTWSGKVVKDLWLVPGQRGSSSTDELRRRGRAAGVSVSVLDW
jgi:hypothetical protein